MSTRASDRSELRTIVVAASLLGAIGCGGVMLSACGSSTKVESKSATVGQELQDLETARNKGLLTEDEYQKQREAILKRK